MDQSSKEEKKDADAEFQRGKDLNQTSQETSKPQTSPDNSNSTKINELVPPKLPVFWIEESKFSMDIKNTHTFYIPNTMHDILGIQKILQQLQSELPNMEITLCMTQVPIQNLSAEDKVTQTLSQEKLKYFASLFHNLNKELKKKFFLYGELRPIDLTTSPMCKMLTLFDTYNYLFYSRLELNPLPLLNIQLKILKNIKVLLTILELDNPLLLRIFEINYSHGGTFAVTMEAGVGTLLNYIQYRNKAKIKFTVNEAMEIAFQIWEQMKILRENRIYHRNICPKSIIMTKDGKFKLSEFNLSGYFKEPGDDQIVEIAGTPGFWSLAMDTHAKFARAISNYPPFKHNLWEEDLHALGKLISVLLEGKLEQITMPISPGKELEETLENFSLKRREIKISISIEKDEVDKETEIIPIAPIQNFHVDNLKLLMNSLSLTQMGEDLIFYFSRLAKVECQERLLKGISFKPSSASNLEEIQVMIGLSSIYMDDGNFEKAKFNLFQAFSLIKMNINHESSLQFQRINVILGDFSSRTGSYKEALIYYFRALSSRKEGQADDKDPISTDIMSKIAVVYCHLNDYKSALGYYEIILDSQKSVFGAFSPKIAITYHNLGAIYLILMQNDIALSYINSAKELLLSQNHLKQFSVVILMTNIISSSNNKESSLVDELSDQALQKIKLLYHKDYVKYAYCRMNMGLFYLLLNDEKRALDSISSAAKLFRENGSMRTESYLALLLKMTAWCNNAQIQTEKSNISGRLLFIQELLNDAETLAKFIPKIGDSFQALIEQAREVVNRRLKYIEENSISTLGNEDERDLIKIPREIASLYLKPQHDIIISMFDFYEQEFLKTLPKTKLPDKMIEELSKSGKKEDQVTEKLSIISNYPHQTFLGFIKRFIKSLDKKKDAKFLEYLDKNVTRQKNSIHKMTDVRNILEIKETDSTEEATFKKRIVTQFKMFFESHDWIRWLLDEFEAKPINKYWFVLNKNQVSKNFFEDKRPSFEKVTTTDKDNDILYQNLITKTLKERYGYPSY